MSMIGLVCGQRHFHEHGSVSIWSQLFHEQDSASILVKGYFMSMIGLVCVQRLFDEHGSASI